MLTLFLIALAMACSMGLVSFLEEQVNDEEETNWTRHIIITVMTFIVSMGGLMFLKSMTNDNIYMSPVEVGLP